jgi:hypothetical protein
MPTVSVIPGRNVTSAASVTRSGVCPSDVWASSIALKLAKIAATGAITTPARSKRDAGRTIAPTTRPTIAAAAASRQPPPRIGTSAAAATA